MPSPAAVKRRPRLRASMVAAVLVASALFFGLRVTLSWRPRTTVMFNTSALLESAVFAPDGRFVVCSVGKGGGYELHVRDGRAGAERVAGRTGTDAPRLPPGKFALPPGSGDFGLALAPSGQHLAVEHGTGFDVWDVTTLQQVARVPLPQLPVGLAFATDGKELVGGGRGGVRRWSVPAGKALRPFNDGIAPTDTVSCAASNGRYVVAAFHAPQKVGAPESKVALWDIASGSRLWKIDLHDTVEEVLLEPDGDTIAAISSGEIIVLGAGTGRPPALPILNIPRPQMQATLNRAGDELAVLAHGRLQSTRLLLYAYPNFKRHRDIVVADKNFALGFWPDDNTLAALDRNGKLTTWRLR